MGESRSLDSSSVAATLRRVATCSVKLWMFFCTCSTCSLRAFDRVVAATKEGRVMGQRNAGWVAGSAAVLAVTERLAK